MIVAGLVTCAALSITSADPAFVRERTGQSGLHCLRWPGDAAIVLNLPACPGGQADCLAQRDAVRAAMASWNDVLDGCASVTLVEGPPATPGLAGYAPNGPNENSVQVRTATCTSGPGDDCWAYGDAMLGLTLTTYRSQTGELVDADVELNGATHHLTTELGPSCVAAGPGAPCTDTDVQAVATHELGHLLGLGHTDSASSLMYPTYLGTLQRAVDSGSADGVCSIYPSGQASVDCVTEGEALTEGKTGEGPVCRCTSAAAHAGLGSVVALLGLVLAARRRR